MHEMLLLLSFSFFRQLRYWFNNFYLISWSFFMKIINEPNEHKLNEQLIWLYVYVWEYNFATKKNWTHHKQPISMRFRFTSIVIISLELSVKRKFLQIFFAYQHYVCITQSTFILTILLQHFHGRMNTLTANTGGEKKLKSMQSAIT